MGQFGPQVAAAAEKAILIAKTLGMAGKRIQWSATGTLAWNAIALGQEITEALDDKLISAEILMNTVAYDPDAPNAKALIERHVAFCREIGDLVGLVGAYSQMGKILLLSGDFDKSDNMYEASIQLKNK